MPQPHPSSTFRHYREYSTSLLENISSWGSYLEKAITNGGFLPPKETVHGFESELFNPAGPLTLIRFWYSFKNNFFVVQRVLMISEWIGVSCFFKLWDHLILLLGRPPLKPMTLAVVTTRGNGRPRFDAPLSRTRHRKWCFCSILFPALTVPRSCWSSSTGTHSSEITIPWIK